MAIKANVTKERVDKFIAKAIAEVNEQTVIQLGYMGEDLVNNIRTRSADESWYDQTGNLRSSIGATVIVGGKQAFMTEFKQVKGGTQGVAAGRQLLQDLASKYSTQYAFVMGAGMEYASHVEEMKKKDVLATSELEARQVIDSYLQDALDDAMHRLKNMKL